MFAVLAWAAAAPVQAQDPASHLAGWYAVEARWIAPGDRWGAEFDVQLRDFQFADDFAQVSVRTGALFRPAAFPVSLVVGGAFFASGGVGPDETLTEERRIYQTASFKQRLSPRVRLLHRARAEQRWFERDGFRTRYRYRIGVETRISGGTSTTSGVALVVSDELLVNGETTLESGREVPRLDQNRSYVAVNWAAWHSTRIEVGYLNVNGEASPIHRLRATFKLRF